MLWATTFSSPLVAVFHIGYEQKQKKTICRNFWNNYCYISYSLTLPWICSVCSKGHILTKIIKITRCFCISFYFWGGTETSKNCFWKKDEDEKKPDQLFCCTTFLKYLAATFEKKKKNASFQFEFVCFLMNSLLESMQSCKKDEMQLNSYSVFNYRSINWLHMIVLQS